MIRADGCAVSSDGYRDGDDFEAAVGAHDGVWRCMRHHEQVGPLSIISPLLVGIAHTRAAVIPTNCIRMESSGRVSSRVST